ncbi:MAG TPA: tRNA (guanosine(37)-N1)-methyltransferase TrmD [Candidatus Methylomirabilis sp.]|nr:tRNA (guanosine(37)-N1)-methyltransferase TrmD [Candidatus Methylomirabilis sp.]
MRRYDIVTIFPGMFAGPLDQSILRRAQEKHLVEIRVHDLRDWTHDRHRVVDDVPYGGGAGMVLKPEPFFEAVDALRQDESQVVLLTPQGERFTHAIACRLAEMRHLIFLCGRYEGFDERVRTLANREVSIGDYVVSGGELPALVLIDATVRLIPGVLGDEDSAGQDSFAGGLLDHPQYTRPPVYRELRVPDVLLSGDHKQIRRWRRKEALHRTLRRRPDLLDRAILSVEDQGLLSEIRTKEDGEMSNTRRGHEHR